MINADEFVVCACECRYETAATSTSTTTPSGRSSAYTASYQSQSGGGGEDNRQRVLALTKTNISVTSSVLLSSFFGLRHFAKRRRHVHYYPQTRLCPKTKQTFYHHHLWWLFIFSKIFWKRDVPRNMIYRKIIIFLFI